MSKVYTTRLQRCRHQKIPIPICLLVRWTVTLNLYYFKLSEPQHIPYFLQDTPALEEFYKSQGAFKEGFIRFQPGGCVMPRCFTRIHDSIQNFAVKEDDIWISSFPKCGTTWTQVIMKLSRISKRFCFLASRQLINHENKIAT